MNRYLKTIFLANGMFVFANSLLGPLWAIFIGNFEDDIAYVSLTVGVHLAATSIFLFFFSKHGDKFQHPSSLLAMNFLLRAFIWGGYAVATNIWTIILLQVLVGIAEAIGGPAFNTLVAQHLDKDQHIRDYSVWMLIQSLVAAVAAFFGSYIVKHYGFDALAIGMSGIAIICTFVLILGLDGRFAERIAIFKPTGRYLLIIPLWKKKR